MSDRHSELTEALLRENADGVTPDSSAHADRADLIDSNEVVSAGDPRLPESVRNDHPSEHLREGNEKFAQIVEAYHRDSAEGFGADRNAPDKKDDSTEREKNDVNTAFNQIMNAAFTASPFGAFSRSGGSPGSGPEPRHRTVKQSAGDVLVRERTQKDTEEALQGDKIPDTVEQMFGSQEKNAISENSSGGQRSDRAESPENRNTDTSRGGSAAEAVGRGGGGGKPPVPPTGGPGGDSGSGSGSGDNSSSNNSSTRGPSDERWSSKTSEERRRAAEPYLKDLDHSSWDAGVRDFINRLNDPEFKGLRDIFYKSDGARRCTEDSIPIGGKDSTIPKLEKAPDGSLSLKKGEVQTNAVKYLGEKIMTKVEANPKGSMRTIMSALDQVMRKRSYAYSMFRDLNKIVQDKKETFGKESAEANKSREFRKPWADKATKLSETVGEIAGHRAVLDRFDGTKWLKYEETVKVEGVGERTVVREKKLPELAPDTPDSPNPIPIPDTAPGSGSGQFDMIYRTKDGGYVVVEAKSNQSTELGSRTIGEGANQYKVKQGTREYFDEIIRLMRERGGRESDIADDIDLKLLEGKVHYVEGKGKHSEKTGYTGESLRFFDLRS
ncbi:hypothetical protein [Nocardiopsis salina]|uniref:hypothetical protein n=1 Tax=Nocardiopsis salina TaxID=245836 RepID=UPI001376E350|nr:hypothetical protein [Nocardiopsis salina]